MKKISPKNPPKRLDHYSCAWCSATLSEVKKVGCRSMHSEDRASCNRDGWGSLRKKGWNDDQPEPPVDLDALENWLIDNQHRSKFTLDAGINVDDADQFRAAISELRSLRIKVAELERNNAAMDQG